MKRDKLDLLRRNFKNAKEPIKRLDAFIDIAREYTVKGPRIERRFACIIEKSSNKQNYERGKAIANDLFAYADIAEGILDKALERFQTSKTNWRHLQNVELELAAEHNIAIITGMMGNPDKEIESYFSILLRLEEKNINPAFQANVKGNLGIALCGLGHYERALEFIFASIELNKQLNNDKNLATRYQNLATTYSRMGEYQKAEDACYDALLFADKSGYDSIKSMILIELGICQYKRELFQDSINTLNHAAIILKKTNHKTYSDLIIKGNLAAAYVMNNEKAKSLKCLAEGEELCKSSLSKKEKRNFYWSKAFVFSKLKDYKNAYDALLQHKLLSEQLSQEEAAKRIEYLEVNYKLEHYKGLLSQDKTATKHKISNETQLFDYQKRLTIPVGKNNYIRPKYRDIILFKLDKLVYCYCINNQSQDKRIDKLPTSLTIDEIEKRWPGYFIRTNRQQSVNPFHIEKLKHDDKNGEKGEVVLSHKVGFQTIVSKELKSKVWDAINNHQNSLK